MHMNFYIRLLRKCMKKKKKKKSKKYLLLLGKTKKVIKKFKRITSIIRKYYSA